MTKLWSSCFGHLRETQGHISLDLLAPADEEVLSRVNRARAGKVLRWISHHLTPSELLVLCLVMRPVMNLMGFLFREEARGSAHSITILMAPESPATAVVMFLLGCLADLDAEFWFVYVQDEWNADHVQLALDSVLTIAAGVWWRVIRHLQHFPWRLWHVVNLAAPESWRQRHIGLLDRCCRRCFDRDFTLPIVEQHGVADISQ